MKPNIEELRKKYMENSPEGLTSQDIRNMSEDALLDMDYFLNGNYSEPPIAGQSQRCLQRQLLTHRIR